MFKIYDLEDLCSKVTDYNFESDNQFNIINVHFEFLTYDDLLKIRDMNKDFIKISNDNFYVTAFTKDIQVNLRQFELFKEVLFDVDIKFCVVNIIGCFSKNPFK